MTRATFSLKGGQRPQIDILWAIRVKIKTQMYVSGEMIENPRKTEAVARLARLRKINKAKTAKRWYHASTSSFTDPGSFDSSYYVMP